MNNYTKMEKELLGTGGEHQLFLGASGVTAKRLCFGGDEHNLSLTELVEYPRAHTETH